MKDELKMGFLFKPWVMTVLMAFVCLSMILGIFEFLTDSVSINNKSELEIKPKKNKPRKSFIKKLKTISGVMIFAGALLVLYILTKIPGKAIMIAIAVFISALPLLSLAFMTFYYIVMIFDLYVLGKIRERIPFTKRDKLMIHFSAGICFLFIFIIRFIFLDIIHSFIGGINWVFIADLLTGSSLLVSLFLTVFFLISLSILNIKSCFKIIQNVSSKDRENPAIQGKEVDRSCEKSSFVNFHSSKDYWQWNFIVDRYLLSRKEPIHLWDKVTLTGLWIFLILLDIIVLPLQYAYSSIATIGSILLPMARKTGKKFLIFCRQSDDTLGLLFYRVALLALIVAALMAHAILLENNLLSDNGMRVFEFGSSVILIPIILSQMLSIRDLPQPVSRSRSFRIEKPRLFKLKKHD